MYPLKSLRLSSPQSVRKGKRSSPTAVRRTRILLRREQPFLFETDNQANAVQNRAQLKELIQFH